jgi:hypothetical protein
MYLMVRLSRRPRPHNGGRCLVDGEHSEPITFGSLAWVRVLPAIGDDVAVGSMAALVPSFVDHLRDAAERSRLTAA